MTKKTAKTPTRAELREHKRRWAEVNAMVKDSPEWEAALRQVIKDEDSGTLKFIAPDLPPLPPLPTEEGDVVAMFIPKIPKKPRKTRKA